MIASNVNCWTDIANHMAWLWQAGDKKNCERLIAGYLWALSRSTAAQSLDKALICGLSYVMTCHLVETKSLPKLMLTYH